MKKKKIIVIIIVALVLAVGLFLLVKKNPTSSSTSVFPLKIGSRGQEVKDLQTKLGVDVDGIFGEKTQAALVEATGKKEITEKELKNL